jgi:YidC/Oxa1 family membrane protein insertase
MVRRAGCGSRWLAWPGAIRLIQAATTRCHLGMSGIPPRPLGASFLMNPLTLLDELVARIIMALHSGLGKVFGPDSGWSWGLSIVILVMAIRLLLVPLFVKQIHAQRKMSEHAPHLQELRKKYKGDKQRLQEETMKFYKENGVNPLAGCLPMIPQMIIFLSLFSVLRKITGYTDGSPLAYGLTKSAVLSAQKATIFGVHLGDKLILPHTRGLDLRGSIVIAISVAISATTTFMTVRQTSKRGLMQTSPDPDNPMAQSQKYMMYVVPFFSLTGLYWQFGLVLYWVTTNLWTLCQQFIMFRNWAPPVPATAAAGVAATGGTRVSATTAPPKPKAPAGARPSAGGRTSAGAKSAATAKASGAKPAAGTKASNGAPAVNQLRGKSSATASTNGTMKAASTANGSEKRGGLLRLGKKAEPEPEPVDDVPAPRVVRQQPSRQNRSKRTGKR